MKAQIVYTVPYPTNSGRFSTQKKVIHLAYHLVSVHKLKPEDHWSCIAHLTAEDMLKSAVIEEKTFKHSPWAGADNPLGPKF